MMKKISFALIAVFLFTFALHAATAPVEGTVQKVKNGAITVQVGSDSKEFTFKKNLKFTVNGKIPRSVSLKAGDKVAVEADKNNVAHTIDILEQSAASAGSGN